MTGTSSCVDDDTRIVLILHVSIFRDDANSHADDGALIKKSKLSIMVT